MGAKKDIDRAISKLDTVIRGRRVLVLGKSAEQAFVADLCHEGVIRTASPEAPRCVPTSYRGVPTARTTEFEGWDLI